MLGPYPVERELGRGGMGVVYLGRDPRLQRQVAIKVLSDAFAQHPEHLARFEREAKLLASLNHPNIGGIYGVEDTGAGEHLLVLEYVPGETLAERLARGSLPLDEALDVARQIAAAVEVAHDGGIIHRDLKPGNVKITPDGRVKVLDFGLAKGTAGVSDADLAQSPTFTSVPTATGVILGTAGYMSPEQARGKPVDKRTDVWSFGCVLFECLTGRRIFEGETISDTIASILQREPEWSALPSDTPARVRDLLRRCLEKDLRRRQRDIGDVRIEIEDILAPRSEPARPPAHVSAASAATSHRRWPWAVAALIVTALAGAGAGWLLARAAIGPRTTGSPISLAVTFPADLRVQDFKISPDGSRLILRGSPDRSDRVARLYTRRLDSYDLRPIAGSEGVQRFVFSPDGAWLAVLVRINPATDERRLIKIPVDGRAPPVTLAHWEAAWFDSFTWLDDGDLLVSRPEGREQVIFRISTATGAVGPPRKTGFAASGVLRAMGRVLPGHGVFVQFDTFGARGYQTDVWILDPQTGSGVQVVPDAADAVYLDSGHLLFARDDTIMAAPFDLARRAITGEITALVSGLSTPAGPAGFSLADNGTLAYVIGTGEVFARRLVVIDPQGATTPFVPEAGRFTIAVSLDRDAGRAVATVLNPTATYETWIADSRRSTLRRTIALPKADTSNAIWSPDGRLLAFFREAMDGQDGVYVQSAAAGGDARRILPVAKGEYLVATSWLPDGSAILVTKSVAQQRDLMLASVAGDTGVAPRTLRATPANEENAVVSSDGRLIAYTSDESGQREVYVAAFDGQALGTPLPVSRGACARARWAPGTHRLFFCDTAGKLWSVEIALAASLAASPPQQIHDLEKLRLIRTSWDVAPGGRIVGIQRAEKEDALPSVNLVLNWGQEIRRRLSGQ